MTTYTFDCEFIEHEVRLGWFGRRVRTIELISIAFVCEDGREYYAVNADAPWKAIRKHKWLMDNVIPSLPRIHGDRRDHHPRRDFGLDFRNPRVKPHQQIADEVRQFLLAGDSAPELWASYGAYDHVVHCWLYGSMVDLPEGLPMWTRDLQHEAATNHLHIPDQESGQHNALEDARHVMSVLREEWGYVR
ncbi:hypothetical protein [Nocardiopsis sp. NPDC058789]|uniref:hypothetical protein n=1 Tax=Nocardiopsis sp. NPDC058789 TaxID=3346634 RepID=UPI00366AEC78